MPRTQFRQDEEHFERAARYFMEVGGEPITTEELAEEFYKQEDTLNYRLGVTDGRVLDAFVLLILSARLASQGVDGFRRAGTLAARASELLLKADKKARAEGNLSAN
jgi:hypothetical protein